MTLHGRYDAWIPCATFPSTPKRRSAHPRYRYTTFAWSPCRIVSWRTWSTTRLTSSRSSAPLRTP